MVAVAKVTKTKVVTGPTEANKNLLQAPTGLGYQVQLWISYYKNRTYDSILRESEILKRTMKLTDRYSRLNTK